ASAAGAGVKRGSPPAVRCLFRGPCRAKVDACTRPRRFLRHRAGAFPTTPSSRPRDHAHDRLLARAKSQALVELPGTGVVAHDVQEGCLAASHLAMDELEHEPAGETATLVPGVGAHTADLAETVHTHAFAGHRDQARTV